ncbi:MAG TPA: cysteine--tRNA ligase [Methyloceanibacter sp.]|nr:cysteine--tRNA ligase [Methyloceanibacter sp.]
MALTLYNTLTRRKEPFRPLDPSNVRMYVCGPTVYDFAHIGNARPVIVFDVLYRLLRHIYGAEHVTYVRNITDVDDKINARAAEEYPDLPLNEAIGRVTEKTEAQFHEDMRALGALEPSVEPRATAHIGEMRAMIERLVANGCAYVAEDHVLFHVASMPDYGKLSGRSLDEMIAGARVEVAPFKQDPMDFVLWKPSKPGEPSWPSPAGIAAPGRPGWHIECSAMAAAHLGQTFDIHGGGIDLVFPHHENEIAQSRCANGTPIMAQVWMHNGFLQVEGEKMAKSAGNFVTVHELLTGWRGFAWPGEVVRFAVLMTHYRQPLDFSQDGLEQAAIALRGFATFARSDSKPPPSAEFLDALGDDLNTPRAITELHRLFNLARNEAFEMSERMARPGAMLNDRDYSASHSLAASLRFIGIDIDKYDRDWMQTQAQSNISAEVRSKASTLIEARNAARASKNFKEADRIRAELEAMGITLKDAKDPKTGELTTTWEVAR